MNKESELINSSFNIEQIDCLMNYLSARDKGSLDGRGLSKLFVSKETGGIKSTMVLRILRKNHRQNQAKYCRAG